MSTRSFLTRIFICDAYCFGIRRVPMVTPATTRRNVASICHFRRDRMAVISWGGYFLPSSIAFIGSLTGQSIDTGANNKSCEGLEGRDCDIRSRLLRHHPQSELAVLAEGNDGRERNKGNDRKLPNMMKFQ